MERYVDGFVLPISAENMEKYREIAQKAGEVWKEHGALEYWECAGDDLEIDKMLSFRQIAGAAPEENVIFAWIVFESREQRDKVNAAVMADFRMNEIMDAPDAKIFDYKRMAYGGFKTLVKI